MGGEPHARTAHDGDTKRARGVLGGEPHGRTASGALGGDHCAATKHVRAVPKLAGNRMRGRPLGPEVEIPVSPRTVRRECRNGQGTACENGRWGL
eukprot:1818511-Pyramimonas_sp.AAC.1